MTDLRKVNFVQYTFNGVDFSKSALRNVNFAGMEFNNVKFEGANMDKATFNSLKGISVDLHNINII